MTLYQPESLDAALALLARGAGPVLAGGTDLYPGLRDAPAPARMVDITRIAGLRGIICEDAVWNIGAATTWSDLLRADLPPLFDGLKAAAREVGAVQVQNAGTLAGNLCNASPAADGVPALQALEAEVAISGPQGRRVLALDAFISGPRRTALAPGELVTGIRVPDRPGRGSFVKLGARRYLVISIVMVGAYVEMREGRVLHAAVSVGACAPVARRLPELEAALIGQSPDAVERLVQDAPLDGFAPIDDIRATSAYRMDAVRTLVAQALSKSMEAGDVA
ncbi:FAD binding domain-containing protein [Sulfitobacter sp. D35]|uniref:FAD binding domain-containing protein n=1 Tax=Sulfitobacter sp. D35 TaxID=3083252 RepID=UPI00296F2842|nr:FAD binding domain-containing protein [Sulfitobacter sp. D35]MDW4498517.1 FAD binding domain-containing protein [Sulfitobacter sp. D35]